MTELLPERAIARAQELDSYFETHKKPMGPLHGLPISVKDNICMKSRPCDCGFAVWADEVPQDDAYILKILWSAGSVFYARTTLPQLIVRQRAPSSFFHFF